MSILGLKNLEPKDYHKSEGVSFTGLKEFGKSPAHFEAYLKRPFEQSNDIGTLIHLAILEPERFSKLITVIDGHRGSKGVKDAVMEAEAQGKIVCKQEEYDRVRYMREAILKDRRCNEIFSQEGVAESSIYWKDKTFDVLCRARPDWFIPKLGVIADLKSFSEIDQRSLEKQIVRMRYNVQAAFYLRAIESLTHRQATTTDFLNIFVTTEEPFLARACPMSTAAVEVGDRFIDKLLPRFQECLDKNFWPGPEVNSEGFLELSLPDYAWYED